MSLICRFREKLLKLHCHSASLKIYLHSISFDVNKLSKLHTISASHSALISSKSFRFLCVQCSLCSTLLVCAIDIFIPLGLKHKTYYSSHLSCNSAYWKCTTAAANIPRSLDEFNNIMQRNSHRLRRRICNFGSHYRIVSAILLRKLGFSEFIFNLQKKRARSRQWQLDKVLVG